MYLTHGPQRLQRYTYSRLALSTVIVTSEVKLLQYDLTHGCSSSRDIFALSWVYPWPHALRCFSMTLCTATDSSRCTCCSIDLPTATDDLKWTFSTMDLTLGYKLFTGILAVAEISAESLAPPGIFSLWVWILKLTLAVTNLFVIFYCYTYLFIKETVINYSLCTKNV